MPPFRASRLRALWLAGTASWLWTCTMAAADEPFTEHPTPFGAKVSCPVSWQVEQQPGALIMRSPTGGRAVVRHWATRRDLEALTTMLETEAQNAGWAVRERAERLLPGERTGRLWIFDVPATEDAPEPAIRQLVYVVDTPQGTVLLNYAEQSTIFDRALAEALLERLSFATATESQLTSSTQTGVDTPANSSKPQRDSSSTTGSRPMQRPPSTTEEHANQATDETEPQTALSDERATKQPQGEAPASDEPRPTTPSGPAHAALGQNVDTTQPQPPQTLTRTSDTGEAEAEPSTSEPTGGSAQTAQVPRTEPVSATATSTPSTDELDVVTRAKAEIKAIEAAVELFRADTGAYPDTLEELLQSDIPGSKGPYLSGEKSVILLDPWRRPYVYKVVGSGKPPYAIGSFGADGKPGGEGTAADLFNRKLPNELLQAPGLPSDLAERVHTDRLVLSAALRRFRKDTGTWPATLDELIRSSRKGWRGPYVLGGEQGLLDPWGRAYVYEPPVDENQPIRLGTFGADGAPGGYGEATDVFED